MFVLFLGFIGFFLLCWKRFPLWWKKFVEWGLTPLPHTRLSISDSNRTQSGYYPGDPEYIWGDVWEYIYKERKKF